MSLEDDKTDFFFRRDPESPGVGSATVTPDDAANLTRLARILKVFGPGDVKVTSVDGTVDTWTFDEGLSFPQVVDVAVVKVWATGTTVTDPIKAIW